MSAIQDSQQVIPFLTNKLPKNAILTLKQKPKPKTTTEPMPKSKSSKK
jgi:hypothetical protein